MKMKRRTLLKLIPAVIVGSSVELDAGEIESVEATEEPDCYVGLLSNKDEWFNELHELEGGGYARQGVKWKFTTPAGECRLVNTKDVSFPEAKVDWGEVSHFALYVEPQGGVILFTAALEKPWPIAAGDIARFVAGDLDITMD